MLLSFQEKGVLKPDSVTSGIPQGLILELTVFNTSIYYLHDGAQHIFSKLAKDTKAWTRMGTAHGCTATQKDFDKLERWIDRNLVKFSEAKRASCAPVQAGG